MTGHARQIFLSVLFAVATFAICSASPKPIRSGSDPLLQIILAHYGDGKIASRTDANGNTTPHGYDDRRLLTLTGLPDGNLVSKTYDCAGNMTSLTDEEGKVTSYAYDGEGRPTSVTFAGETRTMAYDAVGNMTSITLPEGNSVTKGLMGQKGLMGSGK